MFTSFLQRPFTSPTLANDRSITLLKLLHAYPEGGEEHVPFCQTPSSRRPTSPQTWRTRMASVIGYLRVYWCGQAGTSAKQRIVLPISPVTGNAKLLLPCLGRARAVRRLPLGGKAEQNTLLYRCAARPGMLDCEQRKVRSQEVFDAGSKSLALRLAPQERRDLVTRALGSSRHAWPSHRAATGWQTRAEFEGVPVDVHHTTVAATEGILAAVLECADPRLAKQERLAALRSALPLLNPTLITGMPRRAGEHAPGGLG